MHNVLTTRQEVRATLSLAWPVIISQLGAMAMGLVDVAFVAPLGAEALGGVAIGNAMHWLVLTFVFGILQALDPLLAQAFGAGERDQLGSVAWQGVWVALGCGGIAAALTWDARWVFVAIGQPAAVVDHAASYLQAMAPGIQGFLLFVVGRILLAGMGSTRPIMVVILVANLLNALLDWMLIYGKLGAPAWGVVGAGVATSVMRWATVLAVIVVVRRYAVGVSLAPVAPSWPRLRRIFAIGAPIGTQNVAEYGVFAAAGTMAGWLGATQLAAHQVALNLAAFVFMVPVGIGIAASVRVGQAVGAGDPEGAARAGRVALGLGAGFMGCGALAFLSLPEVLARPFVGNEPAVLAQAAALLRVAAAFQIADGVQVVASGCLRGAGETRGPMLANLVAHWGFGMPLAWALAFPVGLGAAGLWWGLTGGLVVAAMWLAVLFLRGGWRRIGRVRA